MRLDHIAEAAIGHLFGRFVWRTLVALMVAGCVIAAIYQFTIVGLLALEASYGIQLARLIVGVIYIGFALIGLGVLWMQRRTNGVAAATNAMASPRELQIIMLIEAMMIGYGLARKGIRVSPED